MKDEKLIPSEKKVAVANNELKTEVLSSTRQERRKRKTKKEHEVPKKTMWVQMRILPIYVRVILVILLLAIVILIGLRIGYGYMGDGNPNDVLKKETWTHIIDIIKGRE